MAANFLKPEFFIVGERKCGTSSLYRYLLDHTCIIPCKVKEPQFFSHSRLYRWMFWKRYLALFPKIGGTDPIDLDWFVLDKNGVLSNEKVSYGRNVQGREMTGDASANTFAQVPPRRIRNSFPNAKPIVLLRNPTERAHSHYQMLKRFEKEGRRLPFTLTTFEADAHREMDSFLAGKSTYFIGPGVYHRPLKLWIEEYGQQGVHVIFTENMDNFEDATKEMNRLCQFLDIDAHNFEEILKFKFNASPAVAMADSIKTDLDHFYKEYNANLENLLHIKLPWE